MMSKRIFSITAGMVFLLTALLHVLGLVFGWEAIIGGWAVPTWLSWVAMVIAGYLAYEGFRLNKVNTRARERREAAGGGFSSMDESAFRGELLKRADKLLEGLEKRETSLIRMWRGVVGAFVFVAVVLGVYQTSLVVDNYRRGKKYANYYKMVGVDYFIGGDPERAAAALEEADKLRPNDPEIQCYLMGAQAFLEPNLSEGFDRAEIQCKFVIEHDPPDAEGHNIIGVIYARNRNYDAAVTTLTEAIRLKGGAYDRAEYNLGKTYAEYAKSFSAHSPVDSTQRADYLREAIATNKKLLDRKPKDLMAIYNTSCDYALMGETDNAIGALKTALEHGYDRYHVIAEDSDLDTIRQNKEFKQLITERYAEMVHNYRGLLGTGQSTHEALHVLAWIQLFSKDRSKIEEGIEYANQAIAFDPRNSAYLATLAQLYAARGKYRAALEKIKLAIHKDSSRSYYVELQKLWKRKLRAHTSPEKPASDFSKMFSFLGAGSRDQ
jgi:tetratricopeptide (TPR) repeat protein